MIAREINLNPPTDGLEYPGIPVRIYSLFPSRKPATNNRPPALRKATLAVRRALGPVAKEEGPNYAKAPARQTNIQGRETGKDPEVRQGFSCSPLYPTARDNGNDRYSGWGPLKRRGQALLSSSPFFIFLSPLCMRPRLAIRLNDSNELVSHRTALHRIVLGFTMILQLDPLCPPPEERLEKECRWKGN